MAKYPYMGHGKGLVMKVCFSNNAVVLTMIIQ